ncbi:MAG: hypothetical protein AAFR91_13840 [Pseudomonadota bacterium]
MSETRFNRELLEEIHSLNQLFVEQMLRASDRGTFALDESLADALRVPGFVLPRCPFLLFRPVRRDANLGVGTVIPAQGDEAAGLVSTTLALLRSVAREDLPAACLLAGGDANWCESLAALRPDALLALSQACDLKPRLVDVPGFWQDLLRSRSVSRLQRASLGATGLQLILSRRNRLSSLAPRRPIAATRVADAADDGNPAS